MKALIVDDEPDASEVLELMIKVHIPEIKQLVLAVSGEEASRHLSTFVPDLVFLDIRMPEQSGFDWLASLSVRSFDVIFTTAYDQYAIQAIRYSAFDYLLKPIDPDDLRNAIDRYLQEPVSNHTRYVNLLYNVTQNDASHYRLTIATTNGTYYFTPGEIVRCEADGNYTHFYTTDNRHIMASRPLAYYDALLPSKQFIRCHKSHLINIDFIASISEKRMKLRDGTEVDISRRRIAAVKDALSH